MARKKIIIAIILCAVFLMSSSLSLADQWSVCTLDKIGIAGVSGNVYIYLTHVSGGTSWEGSRSFRVYSGDPGNLKTMMALALTAQSMGINVSAKLADTAENSLCYSLYTVSSN